MDIPGLATRLKRQFGDESGVQVVDADIINWINDAQQYIVSNNEDLLQQTSTVNIVAGQQDYTFPTDLLTLFSVSMKYTGQLSYNQLKQLSIQEFNELINGWDGTFYGSSMPYVYTVFNSAIKIFPPPDAAVAAGIKWYYNRTPTVIAALVGNFDLPAQYHNAILNYCLQQAYEMDENFQASQLKAGQVDSAIHNNKSGDNRNANEAYQVITVLADDAW